MDDEGIGVGDKKADNKVVLSEVCKHFCDETSTCKSFATCEDSLSCYLKDRELDGSETSHYHRTCKTYYRDCGK